MEKKSINFKRKDITGRNGRLLKFTIKICVTIILLICVFSQIELQQFDKYLKNFNWQFIITIWILIIMLSYINSVKMQVILKKQGCNINISKLFAASAVTSFYGMFIPGLLSTSVKWYILKKDTGKGSHVFSSMVYNQFTEVITILVFGLTVLAIVNPASVLFPVINNKSILPIVCLILIISAVSLSLSLLNPRMCKKTDRFLGYMLNYLPHKPRQKAQEVISQLAVFQTVGYRFHFLIMVITIVNTFAGSGAIYFLAAKGANIEVPLGLFFWMPAIIYILGKIPISIANLGVREITLIGILTAYGVDASAALLMSMILFSSIVFMAIIGAICQIYLSCLKANVMPKS
ncbi:MAG TPA: lysylphosphatidylglycerol synthase transmembrane domain-containing protein [Sedimentisphaerales bacterium]|nr:lysylphosphatidylglycerol synthase transmembrane domain-containing protein [Sedimentisphaerales bacterium]